MKKDKLITLAGIGTGLVGFGVAVASKVLSSKSEDSYNDIYGGTDTDCEDNDYDEFWEETVGEYGDEEDFAEYVRDIADYVDKDPMDYLRYLAHTIRTEQSINNDYNFDEDEYDPDSEYSEEDDLEEDRYYEEPEEDPDDIALDIQRATYLYNKLFKKH